MSSFNSQAYDVHFENFDNIGKLIKQNSVQKKKINEISFDLEEFKELKNKRNQKKVKDEWESDSSASIYGNDVDMDND